MVKLLKQAGVILTRFVSLTRTGNFLRDRDVILAPLFSRHLAGPWPCEKKIAKSHFKAFRNARNFTV